MEFQPPQKYTLVVKDDQGNDVYTQEFKGPPKGGLEPIIQRTISSLEPPSQWFQVTDQFIHPSSLPIAEAIIKRCGPYDTRTVQKEQKHSNDTYYVLEVHCAPTEHYELLTAVEEHLKDPETIREIISNPEFDIKPCLPHLYDLGFFDREIASEGSTYLYWFPSSHHAEPRIGIQIEDENYEAMGPNHDLTNRVPVYQASIPWLKNLKKILNELDLDQLAEQFKMEKVNPPREG